MHPNAMRCELHSHPGRIGVNGLAQQQFVSNGDDFR